jgi:hypothetical protein
MLWVSAQRRRQREPGRAEDRRKRVDSYLLLFLLLLLFLSFCLLRTDEMHSVTAVVFHPK